MKATRRAQTSNLKPHNTVLQRGSHISTIYIGNLDYTKREGEIKKMFQKFGKVVYVKLILDTKTNKSKGIAFVQMSSLKGAEEAIQHFDGQQVDGRTLKVSIAAENDQRTPEQKIQMIKKKLPISVKEPVKAKAKVRRKRNLTKKYSKLGHCQTE